MESPRGATALNTSEVCLTVTQSHVRTVQVRKRIRAGEYQ